MKRVLAILGFLIAGAGVFAALGAGGTDGNARVDAIFDSASFLIPGQDVKIAGARVGQVSDVVLTPDNKARIEMKIDPAFTPFHADADCTIQPQSLIGEKFIDCTPGTPDAAELKGDGEHAPTVPITQTHAPVDLDLVYSTFRRPTNERLAILLNALGTGLAARGDDLNEAIRRANPALAETRRVLRIVSDDRANLQRLIGASDHVLATLASRRERIGDFITSSRKVSEDLAARKEQLGASVEGLPPLLEQAEPALRSLQKLAQKGTPILRDLRQAAPQLSRLADQAKPLTAAARPALSRLGRASAEGDQALKAAAPVVKKLKPFAALAAPTGSLVNELFQSLKQTGTVEGLQDFVYQVTLTLSRFDKISHIVTPYILANQCVLYATVTAPSCNANFSGGGATAAKAKAKAQRKDGADEQAVPAAPKTDTAPQAATTAPAPATERPKRPITIDPDGGTTIQVPGLPPIKVPPLKDVVGQDKDGDGRADDGIAGILGFLLK